MNRMLFRVISTAVLAVITVSVLHAAGRGTVSVTTAPVPGQVSVDGKALGEAPITISLEGEHLISFEEYSPQYETPAPRKIRIGAGYTLTVRGVYRNRMIPSAPPSGFASVDTVFVFGIKDRPMRNGTIFDYIDGGALVYLRHGLRETTHVVYRKPGNSSLTLDIFDMGSPERARAGFDDPEICPEGHAPADIGFPAKAYHYEPDYFLYFHTSRFLVYVATDNDSLKSAVDSFAARVGGSIP